MLHTSTCADILRRACRKGSPLRRLIICCAQLMANLAAVPAAAPHVFDTCFPECFNLLAHVHVHAVQDACCLAALNCCRHVPEAAGKV